MSHNYPKRTEMFPRVEGLLEPHGTFVVLYCNFTSLAFLGLLGFLRRQLKIKFIATLLSAAKGLTTCLATFISFMMLANPPHPEP